jgi:hydrogenase nickel incorporation protein HypA/HybF
VHELTICTSIADVVSTHARGRQVACVHLEIGHLRQVVPDTLRHSWDIVVAGTPLEGSTLEIEHVPVTVSCRSCGARTTLGAPVFRCSCGSVAVDVVAGDQLVVTSLDLLAAAAT